jgi:hypothetical protein
VTEPYHWMTPERFKARLDSGRCWCAGEKQRQWELYLAEWQARQQERLIKALEGTTQ